MKPKELLVSRQLEQTESPSSHFPVLVVEDQPVSRLRLVKTLTKAGYEVVAVENGRQAREVLEKRYFPFVLTDWMMPELDGLDLCRWIRGNGARQGYVFVVLLTAREEKSDMIEGLEAGADDYLVKPFITAELFARLKTGRRFLEQERSLQRACEAIRKLSKTDPLTGCHNRGFLNERLPQEILRARRFGHCLSLAICDLDHFKQVNDIHGHPTGDQVLIAFVKRIQRAIRDQVDWLARYGGEEFVMVLPETDLAGAVCMAERLLKTISERKIQAGTERIGITASMGVTGFGPQTPDALISPENLVRQADSGLYLAKARGRNRVCVMPLDSVQPLGPAPQPPNFAPQRGLDECAR
jgi:two-component system, cell cycle response regulator